MLTEVNTFTKVTCVGGEAANARRNYRRVLGEGEMVHIGVFG